MTSLCTKLLLSAAALALMSCGGSNSDTVTAEPDPVVDEDETGEDNGNGTTSPPILDTGTNGLNFGDDGQSLSDAEAVEITTRSAGFKSGADADVSTALITLDAGFLSALTTDRSGTVQIGDETVTITNGAGTLSTGETVIATYEADRAGTYAGVVDVSIIGSSNDAINGESAFVFGFETDPDTIADHENGTLEYVGGFQAAGSLNGNDDTSAEFEGDITISVDFTGAGTVDVALHGQLDGTAQADLGGTMAISGNGFSGDLACSSGCTGDASSLSAGFFGPDADEVAGVLGFDFIVDGDEFDGVGAFVLTDPVAR